MLNDIVTTQELADYIHLTPERVQQLVGKCILEPCDQRREKGKGYLFDSGIAVQNYIEYLQSIVNQRKKIDESSETAQLRKLRADADWKEHQAEKMRLEVERMKNNLHEAELVAGYIGELVSFARSQIEMIPKRAARPVLIAAGVVPTKIQETAAIRALESDLDCVLQTFADFEYRPEELASQAEIIDESEIVEDE